MAELCELFANLVICPLRNEDTTGTTAHVHMRQPVCTIIGTTLETCKGLMSVYS